MSREITRQQFEETLAGRDLKITCSDILRQLEIYHGRDIHKIPKIRRSLQLMLHWINKDWADSARDFNQFKDLKPENYNYLVPQLYSAFVDELYTL